MVVFIAYHTFKSLNSSNYIGLQPPSGLAYLIVLFFSKWVSIAKVGNDKKNCTLEVSIFVVEKTLDSW